MLTVALTGGIGTGKSVVLNRFSELGVPVVQADALAHDALSAGTVGAEAVRDRFGPAVMKDDGGVDRRRLAAVVFADAEARRDLEAIVHPDVRLRLAQWLAEQARGGAAIVVVEIPLLFETGRADEFDAIVVTTCDQNEQTRRVSARDGLSDEDVRRRIAAQWPLAEKERRAHFVIRTDGRVEDTLERVDEVWAQLRARGR